MGTEIDHDRFTEGEFVEFKKRLLEGLEALDVVLARPGFGRGKRSIGAELELFIIDDAGRPMPISRDLVDAADTPSSARRWASSTSSCRRHRSISPVIRSPRCARRCTTPSA